MTEITHADEALPYIELELDDESGYLLDSRYLLYKHETILLSTTNWLHQDKKILSRLMYSATSVLYGKQSTPDTKVFYAIANIGTHGLVALAASHGVLLSFPITLFGGGIYVRQDALVALDSSISVTMVALATFSHDAYLLLEGEGLIVIASQIGELSQVLERNETIVVPMDAIIILQSSITLKPASRSLRHGCDWIDDAETLIEATGPGILWLDIP